MNSLVIWFSWKHCNLSKEVCRQILFSALNDNRQSLHFGFFPSPSETSHVLCGLWKIITISFQHASESTIMYWNPCLLRSFEENYRDTNSHKQNNFFMQSNMEMKVIRRPRATKVLFTMQGGPEALSIKQANKNGLLRKRSPLKSLQLIMQGGGSWDGRNHTGYIKSDT